MKRSRYITRTEKWQLAPTGSQKQMIRGTLSEYRLFCRALIGVVWTHLPEILSAKSQNAAVEHLIHPTKKNPSPRYSYFCKRFYKFPSYLRRAAIRHALGQVESFDTRYGQWLDGERRTPKSNPPGRTSGNHLNPTMYRGQCVKFNDEYSCAHLKLWNGKTWEWEAVPIKKKGKRYSAPFDKRMSPSLEVHGKRFQLAIPYQYVRPEQRKGNLACSIDLGINTTATAAIVTSDGTVTARRFFHRAADIDRRDKGLGRIRQKASATGRLSKGFCRKLYKKAANRNLDMSRRIASEIVAWAVEKGASVIVLEDMKHFRPNAGRRGSSLRQRFHGWLHRQLVERITLRAEEEGLRIWSVNPAGTSKYAFDGSGQVKREKGNAALATFPSGKAYNADLNAAYNIGAKYWYFQLTHGNKRGPVLGRSPQAGSRTPITLSSLWQLARGVEREAATTAPVGV